MSTDNVDNRVEDFQAIVNRLHKEIKKNGGELRYQVTVRELKQCVVEERGEWTVLIETESKGKHYGYSPSMPTISKVETILFSQTVNDLNISEVVKAVNNLK